MIAITGVSGLVGGNLARVLITRGETVRGILHQDRRAVEGLKMELVHANLRDLPSLTQAFAGVEVVYHLAGLISLSEYDEAQMQAINVEGVRNVLAACQACGVGRLVHFSSVHALEQEPLDVPVTEERPLATSPFHPPYDRSKAFGESLVRQAIAGGLDGVILNPTAIVGPYDFRPSYFGQALILIATGRLPALVSGGFDWVDVRDVVEAAIQAAQHAPSGSRFLLSGHWRSVAKVAQSIARLTGVHPPRLRVSLGVAHTAAPFVELWARLSGSHPLYTRVSLGALRSNHQISHERASQALFYRPRPFDETIHDTLDWFTQNGFIPPLRDLPEGRPEEQPETVQKIAKPIRK